MKDLGLEAPPLNCWAAGIMLGLVQILAMGLFKPLGVSRQFVEADAEVIGTILTADSFDQSQLLPGDYQGLTLARRAPDEALTLVTTLSSSNIVRWDTPEARRRAEQRRAAAGRDEPTSSPTRTSTPTRASGSTTPDSRVSASRATAFPSGPQPAIAEPAEPETVSANGLLARSVAQWRQATADEPDQHGAYDRWFVIGIPVGAALASIQLRRRRLRITTAWSRANSRSGPAGRALAAFCGGFVALFGAAIARGALTGQFVSGWTQLSVSALPFTVGMIICGLVVAYMTYPQTPGPDGEGF